MRLVDYPLRTLLQLREKIQQQREQQLAEALAERGAASAALAAADSALASATQGVLQRREAQARRCGATRAVELQRSSGYLQRLERRLVQTHERRQFYLAQDQARMESLELARERLAEALRQVEVVRLDFERWTRAQRAEAHHRAEQELDDLVLAQRGRTLGRP